MPNRGVNGVDFKNGKYFLILTSGQHKIEIKK
jgi:hypothetical protein